MKTGDDLDLRLGAWMAAVAPATVPPGLVDRAMTGTERVRQRSGFLVRTGLGRRWIAVPTLSPAMRLALVGLLVLAALAASLVVGSLVLRTPTPLPSYRGEFLALDPLADRLELTSAVTMADGRVLLAGALWDSASATGENWQGWTVQVWDPATGRAVSAGQRDTTMPIDKVLPLQDGRVLITHGWLGPLTPVTSAEIFDPATGSFTPTGSMTSPRGQSAAVRLTDGRVLVTGGEGPGTTNAAGEFVGSPAQATAEIFDPATGTFSPTGSMTDGRLGHSMAVLEDGRVLVLGGESGTNPGARTLDSAEIYDPSTGKFSPTGQMTKPRGFYSGVQPLRLPDGRVLVVGGARDDGASTFDARAQLRSSTPISVEIFDPSSGTFQPAAAIPHGVLTATSLADGRVLVTGRWSESHQRAAMVPSSMRDTRLYAWAGTYDVSTGSTREIAPLPGAAVTGGSTLPVAAGLADGRVLVIEGWDANDDVSPEGVVGIFH